MGRKGGGGGGGGGEEGERGIIRRYGEAVGEGERGMGKRERGKEEERKRAILQTRKKHRPRGGGGGGGGEEVGFVLAKRCIVYRNCFDDF